MIVIREKQIYVKYNVHKIIIIAPFNNLNQFMWCSIEYTIVGCKIVIEMNGVYGSLIILLPNINTILGKLCFWLVVNQNTKTLYIYNTIWIYQPSYYYNIISFI